MTLTVRPCSAPTMDPSECLREAPNPSLYRSPWQTGHSLSWSSQACLFGYRLRATQPHNSTDSQQSTNRTVSTPSLPSPSKAPPAVRVQPHSPAPVVRQRRSGRVISLPVKLRDSWLKATVGSSVEAWLNYVTNAHIFIGMRWSCNCHVINYSIFVVARDCWIRVGVAWAVTLGLPQYKETVQSWTPHIALKKTSATWSKCRYKIVIIPFAGLRELVQEHGS